MILGPLSKIPCIQLFFRLSDPGDDDADSCMLFFLHQPFFIFVKSWLMNWCPLEIQTRVPLDGLLAAWRRIVQLMIRHPS
jgi:hypothetical protein